MMRPATALLPLALCLPACGTTPKPTTSALHPTAAAPGQVAPTPSATNDAPAPSTTTAKPTDDDDLPPGVIRLRHEDGDPNAGRMRVAPAALELASLPRVEVPEPLDALDAPDHLPPSKATPSLAVEKIDSGWRARGAEGSAVYVVLDAKLGRIQIGAIAPDRNATDRVYRTCGDRYYNKATLTPARWQTLTREGGVTKLTIVDAWFDARSCEASVVRETTVTPKPVLGYMLYGFRSPCASCGAGERVTFIAPPLGQVAADGVGGKATVSHLSLIHI